MNEPRNLTRSQPNYPPMLRKLADAPDALRHIGITLPLDTPMVAIVGARDCTRHAKNAAYRLAGDLTEKGYLIVSGMAAGIDSAAHRGALDAGGLTVAVLGCGVDVCYPSENRELYRRIIRNGLILSEYAEGTKPNHGSFLQRNRLIAGMSIGMIIAESGIGGGTRNAAAHARRYGRILMGEPNVSPDKTSAGVRDLIDNHGAIPVSTGAAAEEALAQASVLYQHALARFQNQ